MKSRRVHLNEETIEILDTEYPTPTKRSKFMRYLVESALTKNKPKMRISIKLTFANTDSDVFNTLTVNTTAIGNLKEKIIPLLDAAEDLQNVITSLKVSGA